MLIGEFTNIEYLQRVVIHLYDLLDDISTADDIAKSNDILYRKLVDKIQQKKNDSGVRSLDGYILDIEPCNFEVKNNSRR